MYARGQPLIIYVPAQGAPVVRNQIRRGAGPNGAVEVTTGGVPITASLHAWPTGQIADRTAVDPAWAHCPCARSSRGGR